MKFRKIFEQDIPDLAKLQVQHPDFAELNIRKYLIDGVVVDKEEGVAAYGIVIPFAEAVFLPDVNRSNRDKLTAMKLLLEQAILGTTNADIKQLHCFIRDQAFADIMKKHYGFKPCVGEALVLEL